MCEGKEEIFNMHDIMQFKVLSSHSLAKL